MSIDPAIKAALREMDRLEWDLFSKIHHTITDNSFAYNTIEYVIHRMKDAKAMLVPHNHPLRRQIENHVYFTPLELRITEPGHIGYWDGVPIVVNTHPTKQTRLATVYGLNPVGQHLLETL